MGLLQNSNAIPQLGGYNLTDSVRFRSSATAYLERIPTTAGTTTTGTISCWIKHSDANNNNYHYIFEQGNAAQDRIYLLTHSNAAATIPNRMMWGFSVSGTGYYITTNKMFRDPSAWYHVVAVLDTSNATTADRLRLYINGERQTDLASDTTSSIPSSQVSRLNSTDTARIGMQSYATANPYDGYITEVNLIDGQALTASDFGEYDDTTGVWKPKRYTGSYGTNGFYLPMKATTQASGFNTVTYTGSGTSGTKISNVGFQPDFVWIKNRTNANNHLLVDSVRGVDKTLESNTTNAEATSTTNVSSFDADGFTLGSGANASNNSSYNYVAWCFEAGGAASSNTNGTITSQVSANTAKGFSIVTYTGTGVAGTIGHGLGSAPEMIILKGRDANAGYDDWYVYHSSLGNGNKIFLNLTDGSSATSVWNSTSPTNDVFSVRANTINTSGIDMVAYCFSEVSGFSKFGSYTGNGTSQSINLGFRPAFVMWKRTDAGGNSWIIKDNTRTVDNSGNLFPNATTAENTDTSVTFTDTGFDVDSSLGYNGSGRDFIYMAFADTRDYQWNFDASGNKNNWTPNNINSNASSETSYDMMSDVPTLTDEDTGNFCTINPTTCNEGTISNGNLTIDHNGSAGKFYLGTMGMPSGKWYFEAKVLNMSSNSRHTIGFCKANESYQSFRIYMGGSSSTYHCLFFNGAQYEGTTIARTISSLVQPASGTIINVAIDVDNNKVFFGKNGTWQNSGDPVAGTGQCINLASNTEWVLATGAADNSSNSIHNNDWDFNFGQQPFAYTPPTGFKKLNTYNLADSAIKDGSQYFDTAIWAGNATNRSIDNTITDASGTETGDPIQFSPDLVWIKSRSNTQWHNLHDSVRGPEGTLASNATNADVNYGDTLTSFDSTGFSLGTDGYGVGVNTSSLNYVGWLWRGSDSTAVTDSSGTIGTVTRSTNTTSGFSIVTYTGTGTSGQTIPHGLGVTPSLIITKRRDTTGNWVIMPGNSSLLGGSNVLFLNTTSGLTANSNYYSGYPSSSYYYSSTNADINASSGTYVSYVFAEVEGFSKIDTYVGNGSADGPFIYTGFNVKFLMYKSQTAGQYWVLYDSTRDPDGNPQSYYVLPSTSDAEGTSPAALDFLSNGFKIRYANASINTSGQTHVYMAFAENPFKNSLAR